MTAIALACGEEFVPRQERTLLTKTLEIPFVRKSARSRSIDQARAEVV
jgi:hypothetical protein